MSVTRIATRYAKSLIELATEQGKLQQVSADLGKLSEAAQNRDLYLMLKSPIIGPDKKNDVLKALFADKMDKLTMAYLELLVKKGREAYLPEIATEFAAQYKAMQKITSVKLTAATPISESVVADLKARLIKSGITHPNLEVEINVDPELIGGFVLEFDDKRYDASVASKLTDLKAEFTKNLYIKEY